MPSWSSMADFVDDLSKSLTPAELRKITRTQAAAAQRIADASASRDLGGDRAFSGWNRGLPLPLATQVRNGRDGSTLLTPTRRSAGPWTVAQFGRNQGNAGGFAGPGINTRTGLTSRTKSGGIRKTRARSAKRWNGYTVGKNTASDAVSQMQRDLPKIADVGVRAALRRRFDVT